MKYLRILGVAVAVLMTTAVASQVATVQPAAEIEPAPVAALVDAKPATAGDPKAGQTKAGACAACHGLDGNSADAQYPKLAGQHERFIWRQLKLYKSGERENAIMQGMAAPLTEQDMRDIGAYFATLKALPGVADDSLIATGPQAGSKYYEIGQRIFRAGKSGKAGKEVATCLACHGPAGRGNPGPSYPSLGGQHSSYTAARLQFFRDGGVWGKQTNANTVMSEVARNLSDEEIQGLSTYIEGLHPTTTSAPAE